MDNGKRKEYAFRASFIDPFQGQVMAKFGMNTLKAKNAAIVYDISNDYSKGLAETFKAAWEQGGGKVVNMESYGVVARGPHRRGDLQLLPGSGWVLQPLQSLDQLLYDICRRGICSKRLLPAPDLGIYLRWLLIQTRHCVDGPWVPISRQRQVAATGPPPGARATTGGPYMEATGRKGGNACRFPPARMLARLLPLIMALVLAGTACSQSIPTPATPTPASRADDLVGSGRMATRATSYTGFANVEARGPLRLELIYGEQHSVKISADDNIVDLIQAEQRGETLVVSLPSGSYRDATPRVQVAMPDLRTLVLSGAAFATISGFPSSQELQISLSGASRVTGRLKSSSLTLALAEASVAELGGSGGSLHLEASGASQARLGDLPLDEVNATLKSVSSAIVNVKGTMNLELNGSSSLYYVGTPNLGQVNISGGANLVKR